jgi:hypothetical protein
MPVVTVPGADWNANTPIEDDDVVVLDSNTVDIVTNVDQKGIDYDSVTLSKGYMKTLAASGDPARWNAKILRILHGGDAYITSDDNNSAGGEAMNDTYIETMERGNKIFLTSSVNAQHADSVWNRISVNRGDVTMEAAMEFGSAATVSIGYVNNPAGDVTLRLTAETGNGNALPNLVVGGGRVFCTKTVTFCSITNARMDVDTKPITTLVIGAGATVVYQHTAGTTIHVKAGGTLDLRERRGEQTITRIQADFGSTVLGYDDKLLSGAFLDSR